MNVDSKNLTSVVKAEVPLAEMFGYVNTIRSLSRGARPTRWSRRTSSRFPPAFLLRSPNKRKA